MRRFIFIFYLCLLLFVYNEAVLASEQTSPSLYYKVSKNPVKINKCASIVYNANETAIIMYDGEVYGNVKCNFAQLLGIADWYNTKAINNGVSSSYTVNFSIDMTELLQTQNTALIVPKLKIINTNKETFSDSCRVGWSGYPESAEVYASTPSAYFELGLQPITKQIPADAFLMLELYDSVSGIAFDPIYYSIDMLRNAEQGAILKVAKEPVDINSINGAVYQIQFNRAELNQRDTSGGTRDVDLYDIVYDVVYKNEPTNGRVVSVFDAFDNNKLSPRISFGVSSDNDQTLLYDTVPTALEETIDHDRYEYVTSTKNISAGQGFRYTTNRLIGNGITKATNYVRIIVSFPEERAARTDAEMKDFNGRYLVYQLKLSEHIVPDAEGGE